MKHKIRSNKNVEMLKSLCTKGEDVKWHSCCGIELSSESLIPLSFSCLETGLFREQGKVSLKGKDWLSLVASPLKN